MKEVEKQPGEKDSDADHYTLLGKSLAAARVLGLSVARAGALLIRRYS